MKPRSKRNRRPRGGFGCLVGDGEDLSCHGSNSTSLPSNHLHVEVVPLSEAIGLPSDAASARSDANNNQRRVRIVHPYPFTFATFAKARWVGRTVVDVYNEEFGSYPKSYYEAAIDAGRILVSGRPVDREYKIQGGDELTHFVHRHEPAVGLSDIIYDNGTITADYTEHPPVQIVYEDNSLLIVDKPSTIAIHPSGAYNYNSLFEILSYWNPQAYGLGRLFTVHRLDRLTSGLVLIAKTPELARSMGKCIMERDGCEKLYLTRVKGKFPLNVMEKVASDGGIDAQNDNEHPWKLHYTTSKSSNSNEEDVNPTKRSKDAIPSPCQTGEYTESEVYWSGGIKVPFIAGNKDKKNKNSNGKNETSTAALGYWITDQYGDVTTGVSLNDLHEQSTDATLKEVLALATGDVTNDKEDNSKKSIHWLNFSCPCRISSHKNGICEAGDPSHLTEEADRKGIKPAQTSFTLLTYDAVSDTSVVLAKPVTGRTHQIRLHLQQLGHPIANDHCYGGELWFGDEQGKKICQQSRDWLNKLDHGEAGMVNGDTTNAPSNSTVAEVPATDTEIYHAAANRSRKEGESIFDFIEKTCVWCARCRGVAGALGDSDAGTDEAKQSNEKAVFRRTLMEYLVRSQGIWLHALQYSLKTKDNDGNDKHLKYRTQLPSWALS